MTQFHSIKVLITPLSVRCGQSGPWQTSQPDNRTNIASIHLFIILIKDTALTNSILRLVVKEGVLSKIEEILKKGYSKTIPAEIKMWAEMVRTHVVNWQKNGES